ncbi:MAG TPA: hypothetical protein VGM30_19780 [Puia sp.]|jgi:hypothetical protein
MITVIPIYELDQPAYLWLREAYESFKNGKRGNFKEIFARLYEELPNGYNPDNIGSRLINGGGENIRLLGIIALHKNYTVLEDCNKVLHAIKAILLNAPSNEKIELKDIEDATSLSRLAISSTLHLVSDYAMFWKRADYEPGNFIINAIYLGEDNICFNHFISFINMKSLVLDALNRDEKANINRTDFESDNYRTQQQRKEHYPDFCQKIEDLKLEIGNLVGANQMLVKEMEEMKALYLKLNKKNFGQLLLGKLGDLALSKLFEKDTLVMLYERLSSEIPHVIDQIKVIL